MWCVKDQVVYPDLTLAVALGRRQGRNSSYFQAFERGTSKWYHLPQETFLAKYKWHIAEEIRYLALATTSDTQSASKQIHKLWPVKRMSVVPRNTITEQQAGKTSSSQDLYYLFELGKPLTLQCSVTHVPHRPIKNSMKLTTLTRLENIELFSDLDIVYEEALK